MTPGAGSTTGSGGAGRRADLLALTPDTLAALTNRGLVKRAARELASGAGAEVCLASDGTLTGRYPDGTETVLPAGAGLDLGRCDCGAIGACRHLLGLVLAYRAGSGAEGPRPTAGDGPARAEGADPVDPTAAPAAPDARYEAEAGAAGRGDVDAAGRGPGARAPEAVAPGSVPAGATVPADASGRAGATGRTDPTVPAGTAGRPDPTGPAGTASPADTAGRTDATAPAGATVPAGATGPTDPTVPAGTTSPTDPTVPAGTAGPAGVTAPSGATGRAGVTAPAEAGFPAGATARTGVTAPGGRGSGAVWSPGDVSDEELTAALGARAVTAARRALARGYTARLTHPSAGSPEARAELATATVRFTVPGALGYALSDARPEHRGEAVVLAVWAFRAALAADPADPPAEVRAGGPKAPRRDAAETARAAADLAADLLLDGAAHAGPVVVAGLRRVHRDLVGHGLHWTADAVADLAEQLAEHSSRGAGHRPERFAELLAEVAARQRADRHGTGEPGTTPLRRVRLTALGCRITGDELSRTARVYFAHAAAGTTLVLHRRWELAPDPARGGGTALTGPELAGRRVAGAALGALAAGNVVSETASRTPGHTVTFGTSRVGGTGVTPLGASWAGLPEPLLVRDFAAEADRMRTRPPRPVRPRVAADDLRVLVAHSVEQLGYDPAEQRLEAVLRDAAGRRAVLAAPYNPYAPGGLDALAGALAAAGDGPVHVSGFVRPAAGSGPGGSAALVVEPLAVLHGATVSVPDLAPAGPSAAPPPAAARPDPDPISAALGEALAALADTAHRGLRRPDRAGPDRLDRAATALERTGLSSAAALVRAVPAALSGHDDGAAVESWTRAHLFLLTASDLHGPRPVTLPTLP
ncbi:hypothetical protein [Streptomyces sp. NPDC048606]|uniref:hypothetical protein n=1 Tax=Streptomyces sp. NPDC048606 TaxID=3154726 RepID=UPI0034426ACA